MGAWAYSAGAIAATSARSLARTDFGSNLRTLAAILVSASAIDIGGAASFCAKAVRTEPG